MATISITREELLKRLHAAKVKADREDARIAAAHRKDEAAALAKFRDGLRSALKWDYEQAKENNTPYIKRPSCPSRNAVRIDRAIAQVNMDSRKGPFHLKDNHDWYLAASWLPESERPKASVCD